METDGASSEVLNLCEEANKEETVEENVPQTPRTIVKQDESRRCMTEARKKTIIGILIVILLAVSWVGAQQFAQTAVRLHSFDAPFFATWFSTCWMVLCFPGYCIFALITEKNMQRFTENMKISRNVFGPHPITVIEFFKIVWSLNAIWLAVNYLYIYGLKFVYATDASAIMASNVAFVYMLSLCLLGERIFVIRILATILCIGGVVLFGYAEGFHGGDDTLKGVIMIIVSAFGAAVYKVVFKKVVGDGSLGQVSLFLTLLGVSNLCIMWLVTVILYVAGVEHFSADSIPWEALNISAALGLIFNFLVNFGIAYTYPLFISIAMMIGIPLNAGVDVLFREGTFSALRLVAAFLVFAGFAIMLFPDSWNDPIHSIMGCEVRNSDDSDNTSDSDRSAEENLLSGSSRSGQLAAGAENTPSNEKTVLTA